MSHPCQSALLNELVLTSETGCSLEPPPYADVQALDPLGVDEFMARLPRFTALRQLDIILSRLTTIVSQFDVAMLHNIPMCFAVLRDLDFIISSAHALERASYKRVTGLEGLLEVLGRATDHSPRGCNFTYGLFNPSNNRMRTFTGSDEERTFICAVQSGTRCLDDALVTLRDLAVSRIDSADFVSLISKLESQFELMVSAVVDVFRRVPPEVFSGRIVKFFDPLDVNGKSYQGITGAQVQNIGIDFILYGVEIRDQTYVDYACRNLSAMLPFQKAVISQALTWLDHASLLTRISTEISARKVDAARAEESLAYLDRFLTKILSFRAAHRRLASLNLPLRPIERGSGGHSLELLDYLIERTQEARSRVRAMRAQVHGGPNIL
jgi:monodechloroaminopyrrolnitrin synthase